MFHKRNLKIFLTSIIILLLKAVSFSQVSVGTYVYTNDEVKLEMVISESGMTISSASVTNLKTNKTETGSGFYTTYPGYETYKITTESHVFFIDIPDDKLKLRKYTLDADIELKSYELIKESFIGWAGTYTNSKGGLLIIGNYIDGIGFNYQLVCERESDCGVLNLAGITKIIEHNLAYEGDHTDFPDIKFELKGNTVSCMPSFELLGNCSDIAFDYVFVRKD
jgi:hypothetical protein